MNGVNYEPLLRDMTWSFSRLNSYGSCPYAWYNHYLMEEPEEEQFYASFGSFCHELIARYYKCELPSNELISEFLQGYCNRVLGLRPSPETEWKYLEQGSAYFEDFKPFPLRTELVEEQIFTTLKNDSFPDGIKFTGIIDYLGKDGGGNLVLVDHKSADLKPYSKRYPARPTQSDIKLDETLRQLYLYSEWVKEKYGTYPTELWLNCFRTGTIIKVPFDSQKCEEAVDWALRRVEEICKDDMFLPTDDFYYCKWICGQHNNCELYEEEYSGGRRGR